MNEEERRRVKERGGEFVVDSGWCREKRSEMDKCVLRGMKRGGK